MAQVIVELYRAEAQYGGKEHAAPGRVEYVEELDSSSQDTIARACLSDGLVADVVNHGAGVVWVDIGPAAAAAVGTSRSLGAGERRVFGPLKVGDLVSVVDDA